MSRSAALHRVPLALGNDADEPLIADDPDAGNVMHRALINGERHRTRDRRANHSAMQHPRHLHVGDVVERASSLPGWIADRQDRQLGSVVLDRSGSERPAQPHLYAYRDDAGSS